MNRKMNPGRVSNLEWGRVHGTVDDYLSFREPSRRSHSSILRSWHGWMTENVEEVRGMTPDEMVEYQRRANETGGVDPSVFFQVYQALRAVNPGLELDGSQVLEAQEEARRNGSMNRYAIVDGTAKYILEKRAGWRLSYQNKVLTVVRSYFEAEHAELPLTSKVRRAVSQTVPPVEQDLTLEEVKQVVDGSNEMYRAVFLSMLFAGMGIEEILKWSTQGIGRLEESLRNPIRVGNQELVKIRFDERKGNAQPYWTLIGGDALQALRTYLSFRERSRRSYEKRTGKRYPFTVFVTNKNTPLDKDSPIRFYWLRNLNRQGIIKRETGVPKSKRYGKNPHQIRDRFRSQWGKVHGKESVGGDAGEFLMGHLIDPNRYNEFYKDPQGERIVVNAYVRVLPLLNIMSSGKPFGLVEEEEVDGIRQETVELQRQVAEQQHAIEHLHRLIDRERDLDRITPRIIDKERDLDRLIESSSDC